MNKPRWQMILISLASTALLACNASPRVAGGDGNGSGTTGNPRPGGGGGGGGIGSGNTGSAMTSCLSFEQKVQELLVRCAGGEISDYTSFFDIDCDAWSANITGGQLIYNAAKATECLTALDNAQCDQTGLFSSAAGPDPACDEAFVGTVMAGEACNDDDVCAGDAECDRDKPGCPGTCLALLGQGEACDPFGDLACADSLYCEQASTSTVGNCVPLKSEGEMCSGGQCADGLSCQMNVCSAPQAVGEACDEETSCGGFARCVAGTCQATAKVGESCGAMTPCLWGPCGSDGKCPAPSKIGDVCGVVADNYVICAEGYCNAMDFSTPGVCVAERANGEACDSDDQCASDICIDDVCSDAMCD